MITRSVAGIGNSKMGDQLDDTTMYSPLTLDSSLNGYGAAFNSSGLPDLPITTAAPPSANPSATGAAPSAGVSGFQAILNTLTSAFVGGVGAYNTVAKNTGLPMANGTPTIPTTVVAQPIVFAGLTQNQLILIV